MLNKKHPVSRGGDSIRGLCLTSPAPGQPGRLPCGWTPRGPTPDSAGRFIEHILHAWGINYYLVETDDDADRISIAFDESVRLNRPVAVLIGTEFGV